MQGRYGTDQLNNAILVLSLILCFVLLFTTGVVDAVIAALQFITVLIWFMRSFSRNVYRRQSENLWYIQKRNSVKNWFKGIPAFFKRIADRKHKYFKCPNCKSRLRVPRGRGSITVTCPRCYIKFDKKS